MTQIRKVDIERTLATALYLMTSSRQEKNHILLFSPFFPFRCLSHSSLYTLQEYAGLKNRSIARRRTPKFLSILLEYAHCR